MIVVTPKIDTDFLREIERETGIRVRNKKILELTKEEKNKVEIILSYGNYNDMITNEDISELPKLNWIHVLSSGTEQLPLDTIKDKDIILTTVRGIHGIPISEYVFTMLLYFTKCMPYYQQAQKDKRWNIQQTDELYGKTIGILGTGSIGTEVAKKAEVFGMIPYGVNRSGKSSRAFEKVYKVTALDDIIGTFDIIVSALPSNEGTRRLVNKELIEKMKDQIIFINVGRGDLVVEHDIQQAMLAGKFKGMALDVFNEEPLPCDSPLWELNHLILTPHMSASTNMYMPRAIQLFLEYFQEYQLNKLA